jgi:hypothetical protein|tara:strand:+ start:1654 stop:1914 length:261 start_codon:yes stop_codon:yes gene_type:complete
MRDRIWHHNFLLYTGPNRYCANCGKQIEVSGKGPQTCSKACRNEFRFQPGKNAADLRECIGGLLSEAAALQKELDALKASTTINAQ